MIIVQSRETNGKKGKWHFHSIYFDGMPGGKKRERDYAKEFAKPDKQGRREFKVEVKKNG